MPGLGKGLVVLGVALAAMGLIVLYLPKIPFPGRLPGDILVKKGNFTFYFPIATSLLISLILTLLFRFFSKK